MDTDEKCLLLMGLHGLEDCGNHKLTLRTAPYIDYRPLGPSVGCTA